VTVLVLLDTDKYIETRIQSDQISDKTVISYRYAQRRIGIESIDSDKMDQVWSALLDKINSGLPKSTASIFMTLLNATATTYGVKIHSGPKRDLLKKMLKTNTTVLTDYTDKDVRRLLDLSLKRGSDSLFRLLVLLSMAGIRASSAEGIKASDMRPVEAVKGTYYFQVTSRGRTYFAIIGENAKSWLEWGVLKDDQVLCPYKARTEKGSFINTYRVKLLKLIEATNARDIFVENDSGKDLNKAAFDSFRRWHQRKLFASGIDAMDIELLAGKRPAKILYKHYIDEEGNKMPVQVLKRVATAYSKSSLMNFSFEARREQA